MQSILSADAERNAVSSWVHSSSPCLYGHGLHDHLASGNETQECVEIW